MEQNKKLFCGCEPQAAQFCWEAAQLMNRLRRAYEMASCTGNMGDQREYHLLKDMLHAHLTATAD